MTNGGPICLSFFLFSFFSFLCAKICMCSLNFGLDSILIHEIYFYFSYYPHKKKYMYVYICMYVYIRDIPFFDQKKKKRHT